MIVRLLAVLALLVLPGDAAAGPTLIHPEGGTSVPAIDIEVVPPLIVTTPQNGKPRLLVPSPPGPTATPTAADQMARSTAAGVTSYTAIPDCDTAGYKCVYDTTAHAWGAVLEDDPQVGTLTANRLCFTNVAGTAVECITAVNAGSDVTADLEEETHATEHSAGGADPITVTNLASACTDAQALGGTSGGTGVECQADDDQPDNDSEVPDTLSLDAETFSVAATVTAGTNAQGQGALTKDVNVVTTASSAPSGVTLPTATTGRRVVLVNKGANTVNVYPASGAAIDGLSANAALALPVNRALVFHASSTTQWYTDKGGTVPVLDYATTATAAGTTTLTAASAATQYFTGSSTQTVKLPSTATLALGSVYAIVNLSTGGAVTVQSSGANTIVVVPAGTSAVLRSISTTLDTAAAWDAPATLFVSTGTAMGAATRKVEFSSDFTTSTSNGVTTVAPGATFKMDGEAIASGEVPQNIQPSPDVPRLYGPNGEASLGYVSQKRCYGGTNHLATCSNDTACPGGACLAPMVGDGVSTAVPFYFVDGIALGVPLKVPDVSDPLKTGTSTWGYDNNGTDLVASALKPRIPNKAADRIIEKICWYANAAGASISLRRTGPGTPVPTPALPTPSGMATPGWSAADSGCVTGQSITWPKDSVIEIGYTNANGVQWSLVTLAWKLAP